MPFSDLFFFFNVQYNAMALLLLFVMILWHYKAEVLISEEAKDLIVEVNVVILILDSC